MVIRYHQPLMKYSFGHCFLKSNFNNTQFCDDLNNLLYCMYYFPTTVGFFSICFVTNKFLI